MENRTHEDAWSLGACLRILYRRKALLLALAALGIIAATVITALQPRKYRAQAVLEVQAINDAFLGLQDINPAGPSTGDAVTYVATQAEILQQDELLEQVAAKLQLDRRPEYTSPKGLLYELRKDIKIEPVRNSRIINVVCYARTPQLAAAMANTLAGTFIDQTARLRQESASQVYQSLERQMAELPRKPRTSAGVDVNRRVYETMQAQAYHAWIAARLPWSNVRLINPAQPPLTPSKPNVPLNLALGTLGGLLLGVGSVMLHEQSKAVLREPGEAGNYLQLPELGAIPQVRNWTPAAIFSNGGGNGTARIERAAMEETDGISESFRATVASILSTSRNGKHPRILLVSSSQPMEGKTTVVSNLGIALAATSQKVLLIDADMRRPRLHKLFNEANSWGLSDLLREQNAVDGLPLDVLARKTSVPHLSLLPSGASTDNVFGLLNSGRMSRLLPLFREEFDYVLVDAPPCLEFADARIMARYAEKMLLVVRANYTDRRTVHAAVTRLRLDGIPLMGVILNRWNPGPGDPYSYRLQRSVNTQAVS
jgi:receptor protein-tyrosine kinase